MPDETQPGARGEAFADALPIDPDIETPPRLSAARRNLAAIRRRWDILVAVAVGGMIGAVSRYALSLALPTQPGTFPWGTFITNVSGSLVLGVIMVILTERLGSSRYARPFVGTGMIGAYTTFSTYVVEADLLVRDGHSDTAAVYSLASLACGLLAVWMGILLGRLIARIGPQSEQTNEHAELTGSVIDGVHDSNSGALQ